MKRGKQTPKHDLAGRVQKEREELFKAAGIVACCRLACASKLFDGNPEVLAEALLAASDLIHSVAERLEEFASC